MPYELHITRKPFWADAGEDIAPEEWRAVVDADPELAPRPDRGPNAAIWNGASSRPDPLLDWSFGNVVAADPDRPLIDKMVALAARMDARVQGVHGELYNLCDAALPEPMTIFETISSWFSRKKR